ncbi:hypothetical protein B4U78_016545 [Microbacterium esteraromaticum]|nr:hypothetical protein B4U78_016545 [Microbacterium esteraromaticum]
MTLSNTELESHQISESLFLTLIELLGEKEAEERNYWFKLQRRQEPKNKKILNLVPDSQYLLMVKI